jgi:hypothetical protein
MTVGETVQQRLGANGKLKTIVESSATPQETLEALFILTLSRKPTAQENSELLELIGSGAKDVAVYEDILWSLLNSTEFAFNH